MKNITEDEFWDSIIDKTPDIKTICLSCGYTENVPDLIYGEFARKIYHKKIKNKVSTIACQRCGKETAISSYWLENNQ